MKAPQVDGKPAWEDMQGFPEEPHHSKPPHWARELEPLRFTGVQMDPHPSEDISV